MTPEAQARKVVDHKLEAAGWVVQDVKTLNFGAGVGIAVHQAQTERYAGAQLKWRKDNAPLRFLYESTGQIIHFTDTGDPRPRAREVFHFFQPHTPAEWAAQPNTLRQRLATQMPALPTEDLRDCQVGAVTGQGPHTVGKMRDAMIELGLVREVTGMKRKMNMLLHGISTANLQNEDTLAEPQHVEGGELMHFDRVLTNPPFSIHWGNTEKNADGTPAWAPKFPERFRFGQVPLGAKKADLMFLQHMLAVTRDGGMVATVMPHGVLFRGGEEKTIRAGLIKEDLLEAVIGVAPNLFYGTPIPAAILVLRQQVQNGAQRVSGKPAERQGKVLFINADREFFEGRAQNYLLTS